MGSISCVRALCQWQNSGGLFGGFIPKGGNRACWKVHFLFMLTVLVLKDSSTASLQISGSCDVWGK